MGLDQYWRLRQDEEIGYHRKFNALEGFMESAWRNQGGEGEFNCEDVYITEEIMEELEEAIESDSLEPTSGFFFGGTDKDEWYYQNIKELKKIVKKVNKLLAEDKTVIYRSWW